MAHEICDAWGRITKEEKRARKGMWSTIRLAFLSRPPFGEESIRAASDEFDHRTKPDMSLSEAYALLTSDQRAQVRKMVDNPAVRAKGADGKEWWIEADGDLLARLERGELVGPIDQSQLPRAAGTRAF